MSEACVSTIHGNAVKASLAHRVDQASQKSLGNIVPFLLQPPKQLLSVGRQRVVFPYSPTKLSPQLFNGIEVGTVGWPCHAGNPRMLHKSVHGPGPVWRGVVVLKDSSRPHLVQRWDDQRSKDLMQVPMPCQVTVDMVKGGSVMPADSPPNHNGATSKGDHFLDCIDCKLLPWTPPDAGSAITGCQTEPRFVSKQNLCPLGTCPPLVHSAPCMTSGSLVPGQHGLSDWSARTKIHNMEAVT